jgi:putative PEP-CTERM system histidine kinase
VIPTIFYSLNVLFLVAALLTFRVEGPDRRFSTVALIYLFAILHLAWIYFYGLYHLSVPTLRLILFSELIFCAVWLVMVDTLFQWVSRETTRPPRAFWMALIGGGVLGVISIFVPTDRTVAVIQGNAAVLSYRMTLVPSILVLSAMVLGAWRLETVWRSLSPKQRWENKALLVASFLICASLGWAGSYRLTYLNIQTHHLLLLWALLLFSWGQILYAIIRYRRFQQEIYISRKMVYASIAPLVFSVYLLLLGLVALLMRIFGVSMPFVIRWLLFSAGLVALALVAASGKVRDDIKFFISTHFYANKYEYRDEWLAFSRRLKGALTEDEVVNALFEILEKSLYTNTIFIWHGDEEKGYRMAYPKPDAGGAEGPYQRLAPDAPLLHRLRTDSHHYIEELTPEEMTVSPAKPFYDAFGLTLFVPLSVGDQLLGMIALGREFTGGHYGHDDFDLLLALGTQAATALLAGRMAEALSRARQQEAWDTMSAFILHDVKNAASMLSLIRQNAPDHIHDPVFQQDMLSSVDDALKRMQKVQERLSALKGEIVPVWQEVDLRDTLQATCSKLTPRLPGLKIDLKHDRPIRLRTDPDLLFLILENLLLNAHEAGATEGRVRTSGEGEPVPTEATIVIEDNGPGIPKDLLPDAIFEPFKTTKPQGSGIGLWQVKRLTAGLGGSVSAANAERGARFTISLPVKG